MCSLLQAFDLNVSTLAEAEVKKASNLKYLAEKVGAVSAKSKQVPQ